MALNTLERVVEADGDLDEQTQKRLFALLEFATGHVFVSNGKPLLLTQSFQLVATTGKVRSLGRIWTPLY